MLRSHARVCKRQIELNDFVCAEYLFSDSLHAAVLTSSTQEAWLFLFMQCACYMHQSNGEKSNISCEMQTRGSYTGESYAASGSVVQSETRSLPYNGSKYETVLQPVHIFLAWAYYHVFLSFVVNLLTSLFYLTHFAVQTTTDFTGFEYEKSKHARKPVNSRCSLEMLDF